MSNSNTTATLNRLLAVHSRSFPRYLQSAPPFAGDHHVGEGELCHVLETLKAIAEGQEEMGERLRKMILATGGRPDFGEFPMEFTDLHDLSLAYIVRRAAAYQRQDIETIRHGVESLRLVPAALALAEESLGMAVGHLECLEELMGEKIAS